MHEDVTRVPGLLAPASISVDRWGIPHIRAESLPDLFFAQGFNVARDRLWQIDLWRKRGLGLLAADLGPGYLEQDRASRLFLYRGAMAAEWAAYDGDARATCCAFAAGINAHIDLIGDRPDRLPHQFRILGTRPAKWAAEDVVRIRSHALSRNALSEVARAAILAKAGEGADLLRQNLEPDPGPLHREVDPGSIPLHVLDVFKLAVAGVGFSQERLAASLDEARRWRTVSKLGEVQCEAAAQGSNNWVVAGWRSATGRPILANDPHRTQNVPPLRYLVHLSAPGLDVIGAGEPVLPGISLGHNGHVAFGLTIFTGPDQEDVYVYETKPGAPHFYRYDGRWEEMRVSTETAAVKGYRDQSLVLKFTRHGPVIHEDPVAHRAYAIRSVWFEPGSAPYFAGVAAMGARNFSEFRHAMRRWSVPTVNQVFADVEGNIAWLTAGRSPVRRNWTGLLPIPGDGRFEWEGFLTSPELPWKLNPEAGFFITANEMNLPADWPHREQAIGYEWVEASRAQRLRDLLARDGAHSVASACAMQTDVMSLPAQRLCRLLRERSCDDGLLQALTLLRAWNGALHVDSSAAALFEVWWTRHLRPLVLERVVGEDITARELAAPGDPASILALLDQPDRRLGDNPAATRDAILSASFGAALRTCSALMGDDTDAWSWGRLHQAHFVHALSALAANGDPSLDVGPLPLGGSSSTPMNATYRLDDFRVTVGASVRLVIDVGDWDASVCINSPGQSGDPTSPHYADLAPVWAAGNYVPLLYSRGAVDQVTQVRIRLVPGLVGGSRCGGRLQLP